MNKKKVPLFVIAIIAACSILAGCSDTLVPVSIFMDTSSVESKAFQAENPDADVAKYELLVLDHGGESVFSSVLFRAGSVSVSGLEEGKLYRVKAKGFNRKGMLVAEGSSEFTATEGLEVTVSPRYEIPGERGIMSLCFSVPETNLSNCVSLSYSNEYLGIEDQLFLDDFLLEDGKRIYTYKKDLPLGMYSVKFVLIGKGIEVSPVENIAIRLVPGSPATFSWDWKRGDLLKLETPEVSIPGGRVPWGTSLKITVPDEDAIVRYTLDGSMPDSSSAVYTEPIMIDSTTHLVAVAVKDGMKDSDLLMVDYVPVLPTPRTSLGSGTYTGAQKLVLVSTVPGAAIQYRIDGIERTYIDQIAIDHSCFVECWTAKSGSIDSAIVSLDMKIKEKAPKSNIADGSIVSDGTELVFEADPSARIFYTMDGSVPDESDELYDSPIKMSENAVVRAVAISDGRERSDILSLNIKARALAPVFTPEGGTLSDYTTVELSTGSEGASIYCTLDGSMPIKSESCRYISPIEIRKDTRIRAFAQKDNALPSPVAEAFYDIDFGSGDIGVDGPDSYSMNLVSRPAIQSGSTVVYGTDVSFRAELNPIPGGSVRYEWYLDGMMVSDAGSFSIGPGGDLDPRTGIHQLAVKARVGEQSLTENIVFEIIRQKENRT